MDSAGGKSKATSPAARLVSIGLPAIHGQNRGRSGLAFNHAHLQDGFEVAAGKATSNAVPEQSHVVRAGYELRSRFGAIAALPGKHHHPSVNRWVAESGDERVIVGAGVGLRGVAFPVR